MALSSLSLQIVCCDVDILFVLNVFMETNTLFNQFRIGIIRNILSFL